MTIRSLIRRLRRIFYEPAFCSNHQDDFADHYHPCRMPDPTVAAGKVTHGALIPCWGTSDRACRVTRQKAELSCLFEQRLGSETFEIAKEYWRKWDEQTFALLWPNDDA